MPFRLKEGETKIQFATFAEMPALIFEAREDDGISQTRYCQLALCRQLAEDLGLSYEDLVARLPEYRVPAAFEGAWAERIKERSQRQEA